MGGDWHPCRLDFKNCSYMIGNGLKEDCAECNPTTPSAPVTSGNRPGADVQTTPRVEATPPPPRGVSDGDAAVRGGEAATAASLDKQRQRWGKWAEFGTTIGLLGTDETLSFINAAPHTEAAMRIEAGRTVVYVRRVLL